MLDPKLEADLMQEIKKDLDFFAWKPDTWLEDSVKAKISIAITRSYQEGMRDAFLKMGTFIKH